MLFSEIIELFSPLTSETWKCWAWGEEKKQRKIEEMRVRYPTSFIAKFHLKWTEKVKRDTSPYSKNNADVSEIILTNIRNKRGPLIWLLMTYSNKNVLKNKSKFFVPFLTVSASWIHNLLLSRGRDQYVTIYFFNIPFNFEYHVINSSHSFSF